MMKWLLVTGAIALGLGITLRQAAKAPRSLDQSSNHGNEPVRSEPVQRTSNSPSSSQAHRTSGWPPDHLPAAQIQIPRTLLAAIEVETDADRRCEALARAVESVLDTQLPTVLDSLMSSDSSAAAELRERLIRRWAESEAPAAAAWAAQLPENSARRAAFEQIAFAWGEADLASTVAWIATLPDGESRHAATLATAYEAARTEPLTALELTRSLEPSVGRDDLLVHALGQWAGSDFATAANWAASIPDSLLRARLIVAATTAAAGQDPATAATLVATDLGPGEVQGRAAVSLVQRWAQSAPQAAAAWVLQFPESPARDAATENLVALWTAQDADAAGWWLETLPEGSFRRFAEQAHLPAGSRPEVVRSVE